MRIRGTIIIRGVVQGVGFRPFVYAKAREFGITGTVKNLGSEVEIHAFGDRFEEFLEAVSRGTLLSHIDSVDVQDLRDNPPDTFTILESGSGSLSGFIPADIGTCDDCVADMFTPGGRYEGYWATSCVNCGPRYSIITAIPYDRERTSMAEFPMCGACESEYTDPSCRRHHAQTIACAACGPQLALLKADGTLVAAADPIREAAALIDGGSIVAIRGVGGFHIACTEEAAPELKRRLGRTEQPLAVMGTPEEVERIAVVSEEERRILQSRERPIVVLEKKDHTSHPGISGLHTIGCMLPYTGLHHLLFANLAHPLLVMTSANLPGYPMITDLEIALGRLSGQVDYILTHNRRIVNRCDDSVVRDGYIIRLSRGLAPKRTAIDLGDACILGVGPELNANVSVYKAGFCITSPHVGNVRNPQTLAYLQETAEKIGGLVGARYDLIVHDLHPQFLSTRYAREVAEAVGAEVMAVQHHRAHIAATTREECVGIAIDGVGYGDDATIWGGEVFAGQVPHLDRVAHLEVVPMPGGDLATRFPERMLYGILPTPGVRDLLSSRGWSDIELAVLSRQVERGLNVAATSSTGRVLDAAAALLGICRERTYDGEPAMKLESAACAGRASAWDLEFLRDGGCEVLSTRSLIAEAYRRAAAGERVNDIAASVQYNLARGVAAMAVRAAEERGIPRVALSGGVAYNRAIREAIVGEVRAAGLEVVMNREYPLGDGCISFGQVVYGGSGEE
ncbi:MAG: carbamoyltransferase HypF [Methanoculleus sp.]|uniref:carbamoyltransferase HypF n=1 Tax=Methanoculleus sp. TaxID=90427 RepID=UPI0025E98673|nr:carbamoyltransferase HypF [Methanoculleus sp.]MCK9317676.1 carbamoyltransferase HypF [Methanoculleus sp.]MDD2253774.1 carbamoyltransferase HypF [Methanoculleus sp.]MDD3216319.1 carbamoyltransferase HypF [Methanoculleus sp.]MDD4313904.1 carbamoyltransferase HypF [Methanoculleus sp.]MDD4470678.1 carbamoyltransferase HypF [Methanoculleus sp.]